jgi:hypothetical protein
VQTTITLNIPGLDEPVPYTLTAKGITFLDRTAAGRHEGAAIIDGVSGWACGRCGFAWFGSVPGDGLCGTCRGNG